jgi:F-type H+-transporting ATPase subunit gamma
MSNVRDLGRKIQSLKNMQKVTRAMNMISSIKLRKYLAVQGPLEAFSEAADRIGRTLFAALRDSSHPVLKGYPEVTSGHLILFTADKGLCGTHNSSVLKKADAFVREQTRRGVELEFSCLGNKGINHAKREEWDIFHLAEMSERSMTKEDLKALAERVFNRFNTGDIQEVWVLGKIYRNSLQQDTVLKPLLPLRPEGDIEENLFLQTEPEGDQLAEAYGEIYLADMMRSFFVHSFLSEYSARLTAMENATNNSEDMISKYTNMQNHARQAAITNELIEIVSGKEALKG